jgi:iron complex transport system ATP-binding protein
MARSGEPLLQLRKVSVVLEGKNVLDSLSMEIAEGESAVILGPNGSGKSTLIKVLAREVPMYRAHGSHLRLRGRDDWSLFELRQAVGLVSSDLQKTFSAGHEVMDTVLSGFFGTIGLNYTLAVSSEMRQKARETLARVGASHLIGRDMGTLSLGEARRVLIARALVNEPRTLLLDEPNTGLDVKGRSEFRDDMRKLVAEGTSLLIVTHDLEDIIPEVSKVIMLREGRIFRIGGRRLINDAAVSALFGIPIHVEQRDGVYSMAPANRIK